MGITGTSPAAEKVMIDLIRASTVARRLHRMNSFSSTVIGLSRRAIRRSRPEYSQADTSQEFVRLHYGEHTAAVIRKTIERNG